MGIYSAVTATGAVAIAPGATARVARVTFDTQGLGAGDWSLRLAGTLNGPTRFVNVASGGLDGTGVVPIEIRDGTLRVVESVPPPVELPTWVIGRDAAGEGVLIGGSAVGSGLVLQSATSVASAWTDVDLDVLRAGGDGVYPGCPNLATARARVFTAGYGSWRHEDFLESRHSQAVGRGRGHCRGGTAVRRVHERHRPNRHRRRFPVPAAQCRGAGFGFTASNTSPVTDFSFQGFEFNLQVGDGGAAVGGLSKRTSSDVGGFGERNPVRWERRGNLDASGSIQSLHPLLAFYGTLTFAGDAVLRAGETRVIARVTFDTTGLTSGSWSLAASNTVNGPTKFVNVDIPGDDGHGNLFPHIFDGTVTLQGGSGA